MAFINVKELSFAYENSTKLILKGVCFAVEKGDFTIIAGQSGSGKSTLLRLLKPELSPSGLIAGTITFEGKLLASLDKRMSAEKIGYVGQDVESQTICDTVWSELAFVLESLGKSKSYINKKVAEVCAFFGISDLYRKKVNELSGGQRQLLNLASVMVQNPELLLLDEPTSMLDPVSRDNFYGVLKKINEELGVTIISVEHNLESLFFSADNIVALNCEAKCMFARPQEFVKLDKDVLQSYCLNLPMSIGLYYELGAKDECPKSIADTKKYLVNNAKNRVDILERDKSYQSSCGVVEIKNAYFRYEKNLSDVLNDFNLTVYENEILAIVGANGVGKTTLLNVLSGIRPLYSGSLKIKGNKVSNYRDKNVSKAKIAMLPQNPRTLFVEESVKKELETHAKLLGHKGERLKTEIDKMIKLFNLENVQNLHPYDISGGEAEKLAIAKVLMTAPEILLMDEPTQALDNNGKQILLNVIKQLHQKGLTVIMVTHDLEFSALVATKCAMFFDGKIVSELKTDEFFSDMNVYTTIASRISKGFYKNTVTCDDIIKLYNINENLKD